MDDVEGVKAGAAADELREAARLAGECAVIGRAVALARWMGARGRPVTAGQVLRKPDVPAAAAALGIRCPERVRSASDVPDLHCPWCVAMAVGLLRVTGGTVTGGHALEGWSPGEAEMLAAWLTGLLAVCEASGTRAEESDGLLVLVLALLTVLQDQTADPEISAAKLIAEMAGECASEADRWETASEWLDARDPEDAARELLESAESVSPRLRGVAVGVAEMLGEGGLPAWRELAKSPCVGPHAHVVLHSWNQGPEPDQADWQWLGTESAAAALEESGPDEALCRIWESVPGEGLDGRLAAVRATGHPDAEKLARAVAGFAASGAPLSIDQGVQLKVTLKHSKPPIWRSIQLPVIASLGDLHMVIQVLFGWDGDHLHAFTVGGRQYSDPSFELELTADEDEMRVRDAFPPGGRKAGYEYDFGASWMHEITCQKAIRLDPGQVYPVCAAYSRDSPVEYPSEENPQEPEPFSLAEVNRKLAELGGG